MNRLKTLLLALLLLLAAVPRADEGMWLPILLDKYTIADMRAKGFKLTAEDIYSVNKASMKDAVVHFGGGCTGELISDQGLLITNHHCGMDEIQNHSSVEHDYLTNGFWAATKADELVNPKLSVRFLVYMKEATAQVLAGVNDQMSQQQRAELVAKNAVALIDKEIAGTHYVARVERFYEGNEYYLFVEEVFTDVRLVGAPPAAIGKFGGDTDNWMWPRHTGDFSLFRIYANKDNKPADYSPANVPYRPKKHFPISLKGVQEGDFTMVFGYPGRTQQYLPSYAVNLVAELSNPTKVAIRSAKLKVIDAKMAESAAVRIQYAAKQANIANAWKKWQGETRGLRKLDAMAKKQAYEKEFAAWATASPERAKYASLLPAFEQQYAQLAPWVKAADFYREAGLSLDLMRVAGVVRGLVVNTPPEYTPELATAQAQQLVDELYRDMDINVEMNLLWSILPYWNGNIDSAYWPPAMRQHFVSQEAMAKYVVQLSTSSVFVAPDKLRALIANFDAQAQATLQADPLWQLYLDLYNGATEISTLRVAPILATIDSLQRLYVQGMREMQPNRRFYPDANSTLRLAYGQVSGSRPSDGLRYEFQTTLEGIIEKDNPDVYDYRVPQRLKDLHRTKDYGQYAQNGTVPVCFVATNHTTGGNSGSPVIDAKGNLIGINFDRSWESTMSDIMYDPAQCRNIALDVRYALFIIDKYAGAKHLIQEMSIVK